MKAPKFQLTSIFSDGHEDEPMILPLNKLPLDTTMNRRGFLGVGITAAALLSVMSSSDLAKSTDYKLPTELYAHKKSIVAIALTSDNNILASYGIEGTIKLWNLKNNKLLKTIETINQTDESVQITLKITPDDKYLIMSLTDRVTFFLWNLPTGKFFKSHDSPKRFIRTFEIYNNTDLYFATSESDYTTIFKMSLKNGNTEPFISNAHESKISDLKFWRSKDILISSAIDGSIKFWKMPTGNLIKTFSNSKLKEGKAYSTPIVEIVIDEKEDFLISKSDQSDLMVWSLPKEGAIGSLFDKITLPVITDWKVGDTQTSKNPIVHNASVVPNKATLVFGRPGGLIFLWSLPDGSNAKKIHAHDQIIRGLIITSDGKKIITCSEDKTIKIWNFEDNELLSFLFDQKINSSDGTSYNVKDKITGRITTYTLPCGSPIPAGAICTCNCVPGSIKTYIDTPRRPRKKTRTRTSTRTFCKCNQICTCVPVRY